MKRTLITFILVMLLGVPARAELIFLKNGEVIRANIMNVTPVFVRVANATNNRKEYLVDEIKSIEQDKTQEEQISEKTIKNIQLRSSDGTNKRIRSVAYKKASEIVAEAIEEFNIKSFEEIPQDVRSAAYEIANQLVHDALMQASKQNTSDKPVTIGELSPGQKKQFEQMIVNAAKASPPSGVTQENPLSGFRPQSLEIFPDPSRLPEPATPSSSQSPQESDENIIEVAPDQKYEKRVIFDNNNQEIIELVPVGSTQSEDESP